jgi:hypothetical protein
VLRFDQSTGDIGRGRAFFANGDARVGHHFHRPTGVRDPFFRAGVTKDHGAAAATSFMPGIIRAIQVVYGRLRNADVYYRSAMTAGCSGRGQRGKRSSFNVQDAILVRLGPVTATRC